MKYLLMRVRAKISFIAFERRMTILELFVSTIQNCYRQLMTLRQIPPLSEERVQAQINLYNKLVTRGIRDSFMNICDYNWQNLDDNDKKIIQPKIDFIKRKQALRDNCAKGNLLCVEKVANKNGEVKSVNDDPDLLTKLATLI